tara:strand:- start:1201 stop:1647 length:447 start_codon:yes stop_codon:yes gene_type:complete
MGVIKPTLTLTANASKATKDAGPLSVALSLSTTDSLTVDTVKSRIINPTTTHAILFDGSAEDDGGTAGTHGGFLYLKNTSAADYDVYIGVGAESMTATSLEGATDADRFMTLKQGEFAWFPYDYEMDISVDAEHNDATLEYWLFNRAI